VSVENNEGNKGFPFAYLMTDVTHVGLF